MPGDGQRDFGPIGPIGPPEPDGGGGLFGPRRKIGLILAGCGLVLLVGLGGAGVIHTPLPRMCFGDDCLKIVANKVTADANNHLTGSFTVTKGGLFDSIHSNGQSGACLFVESAALNLPADAVPPGGKCSSDDQCGGILNDPGFVGWEGICHQPTRTCWIRPGPGFPLVSPVCNKGVNAQLDQPNNSNNPAFDPSTLKDKLTDAAKNKPLKVRVFACLNSPFTPGPNANPPCGGGPGDKLTDFGEVGEFSTGP